MADVRVFFINRFFFPDHSATSLILHGIALGLAQGGHDVHVITSRQLYDDPSARLPEKGEVGGVRIHRVETTRFGRDAATGRAIDYASFYVTAGALLLRLVRAGDVIVAKTDPPLISVIAAAIARKRKAHLVNWLQDLFPEVAEAAGVGGSWTRPVFQALRQARDWSLRVAERNVVIGDRMAERLASLSIDRARIVRIPNWADPDLIRPMKSSPLREPWRLKGKLVVAYSGNLGRVHELDTLVTAIEALAERPGDERAAAVEFVFIGGGVLRRELERLAARRAMKNVRFLPYQPQEALSETLATADVHLVSLRPEQEGLVVPSKVYGVMAAARPVIFIGDSAGEIGQLIDREGCGVSIPVGDGEALADAILSMARDEPRRLRMGAAGRRAFEACYTKSKALESWLRLLDDVTAAATAKDETAQRAPAYGLPSVPSAAAALVGARPTIEHGAPAPPS